MISGAWSALLAARRTGHDTDGADDTDDLDGTAALEGLPRGWTRQTWLAWPDEDGALPDGTQAHRVAVALACCRGQFCSVYLLLDGARIGALTCGGQTSDGAVRCADRLLAGRRWPALSMRTRSDIRDFFA